MATNEAHRVWTGKILYDVYTQVDNRERARAGDWKQRRQISKEEEHEKSKQPWENKKC